MIVKETDNRSLVLERMVKLGALLGDARSGPELQAKTPPQRVQKPFEGFNVADVGMQDRARLLCGAAIVVKSFDGHPTLPDARWTVEGVQPVFSLQGILERTEQDGLPEKSVDACTEAQVEWGGFRWRLSGRDDRRGWWARDRFVLALGQNKSVAHSAN